MLSPFFLFQIFLFVIAVLFLVELVKYPLKVEVFIKLKNVKMLSSSWLLLLSKLHRYVYFYRLQEFITDFVKNAFLGEVHARISDNIDVATRGMLSSIPLFVDS